MEERHKLFLFFIIGMHCLFCLHAHFKNNNIFWGKNPSFSSDWIHDAHTAYGIQGLAAFAHTFSKNHLGLILLSIQKHTHILTAQFHGFGEQEWLLFSLADSCRAIHSRKDRERLKLNMYMFWL